MSSSQVPVFPINAISYVVDRSITNPGDVLKHLEAFHAKVEAVPVVQWHSGPNEIYRLKVDGLQDGLQAGETQLFKYSIGPVEISISYDPKTTAVILQVFLTVPILGTILVGSVSGSLTEGVSVKVGFSDLLGGEIGARLKDGHGYLFYDIFAFKEHFKGEVKIF